MAAGSKENRRRARWSRALTGLALVAALGVGIVLLAPRLVPGDRLASRTEEALAAATGADVAIGAAQLTLVGGPGLRLREVRIRRADQYDLEFAQLDVFLAEWPLLRRQMVIDGLRARGPAARTLWQGLPVELSDFNLRVAHLRLTVPLTGGEPAWPESGSFTFTAARAAWSQVVLEQLEASGGLERRLLTVQSLTAGCGGGRLDAAATVDFASVPGGVLAGELAVDAVDTDALLGAWVPDVAAQLDARLTGRAQVHCRLLDAATALASLEADGNLRTGEGLLRAGPWLGEVGPYLGDRQDLVDIRIRELHHAFQVADGRYLVDTLTIDGPDTEWSLRGAVGLDGRLDLAVHLRLPSGFTPRMGSLTFFAEALRDGQGRVNLDFRLSGPFAEPAVTLDLSALSKLSKRSPAGAASTGVPAPESTAGTPRKGLGAILDKWKGK
jgi:uncharacterized protein YhdP